MDSLQTRLATSWMGSHVIRSFPALSSLLANTPFHCSNDKNHFYRIRFKDPEPSTLIRASTASSSSPQKSSPRKMTRKSSTHSMSTASLPLSSDSNLPSSSGHKDNVELSTTRSSSSSSSSSPVIRYTSSSSSSPTTSPPLSRSSSHSPPATSCRPNLTRSASSSSIGMHRARAGSIGVEGPLFHADELTCPLGSTRGGDSDDDEEDERAVNTIDTSESEGEGLPGALRRRRGRERHSGVPRGGPSFGFTSTSSS